MLVAIAKVYAGADHILRIENEWYITMGSLSSNIKRIFSMKN